MNSKIVEDEREKMKQRFERPSSESCEFVVTAFLQGSGSVNGHLVDIHVNLFYLREKLRRNK